MDWFNFVRVGRVNDTGLNDRQLRFCQEYVIDFNGLQAAIRAGYSEKSAKEIAAENLTKPNIQAKISELQNKVAEKLGINAEWITQRFKEISDRCVQAEPVLDSRGNPTGEFQFDSAGANKATEMLGKMIGVFEKDNSQKSIVLTPPSIIVNGQPPTDSI